MTQCRVWNDILDFLLSLRRNSVVNRFYWLSRFEKVDCFYIAIEIVPDSGNELSIDISVILWVDFVANIEFHRLFTTRQKLQIQVVFVSFKYLLITGIFVYLENFFQLYGRVWFCARIGHVERRRNGIGRDPKVVTFYGPTTIFWNWFNKNCSLLLSLTKWILLSSIF